MVGILKRLVSVFKSRPHIHAPSPPLSRDQSDVSSDVSTSPTEDVSYQRKMGDSELSYYLPSRANGVNDMYLHLGFTAPQHLVNPSRLATVWAILRLRHPLLACKVSMYDYDDVRFVYHPPKSCQDAVAEAEKNLHCCAFQHKDDLIDSYLNGSRTLSNERISYLILSSEPGYDIDPAGSPLLSGDDSRVQNYDLIICAAHFIGDGMALHQFSHDLFTLLGSENSTSDLQGVLSQEWEQKWGAGSVNDFILPGSMEEALPSIDGRFRRAIAKVDFDNSQRKQIGGHSFPRRMAKTRRSVVPTVSFDEATTKVILKTCKSHGVSITAAIFALCNIVWSRMNPSNPELPMMMYSALNVRPLIPRAPSSYWFLAIGYFNIVLPAFIPNALPVSRTFWNRALSAKYQSAKAAKNSMVVSRSREMAEQRGTNARAWGKEDDEKANGTWVSSIPVTTSEQGSAAPKVPNKALMGVSLLGNLDGIYKHQDFKRVKMHTLTTGSRQRNGGILLFGYTFVGKLWLSLGYDEEGFEKETLDRFWTELQAAVDEFLINAS